MRRIGMVLGLLFIFAVLIALGGVNLKLYGRSVYQRDGLLTHWHYIPSAPSGDVLYVAAFDGFLEDWDIYDDGYRSAQVTDARLRLAAQRTRNLPFSITNQRFGDFDLRVQATAVDGPLDNGFGVVFRMTDIDNQYQFFISSDGYYEVVRKHNGHDKLLSAWIASPLIHQGIGATNTLRVVARGNQFSFFINDEQVQLCIPDNPDGESTVFNDECIAGQQMLDTLVDDTHKNGHVGVLVQPLSEQGVTVEFDNLLIFGTESGD